MFFIGPWTKQKKMIELFLWDLCTTTRFRVFLWASWMRANFKCVGLIWAMNCSSTASKLPSSGCHGYFRTWRATGLPVSTVVYCRHPPVMSLKHTARGRGHSRTPDTRECQTRGLKMSQDIYLKHKALL